MLVPLCYINLIYNLIIAQYISRRINTKNINGPQFLFKLGIPWYHVCNILCHECLECIHVEIWPSSSRKLLLYRLNIYIFRYKAPFSAVTSSLRPSDPRILSKGNEVDEFGFVTLPKESSYHVSRNFAKTYQYSVMVSGNSLFSEITSHILNLCFIHARRTLVKRIKF